MSFPIFVINLAKNAKRREAIIIDLAKQDISIKDFTFIPAVYGKMLSREEIHKYVHPTTIPLLHQHPRKLHRTITLGGIGCSLSHMKAWKEIVRLNKAGLILEDDARLQGKLDSAYAQFLEKKYDILFLGAHVHDVHAEEKSSSGYLRLGNFWGTHAYFVTPTFAAFLLRNVLPLRVHLDHFISQHTEKAHIYVLQPNLVIQDGGFSSDCSTPCIEPNPLLFTWKRIIQEQKLAKEIASALAYFQWGRKVRCKECDAKATRFTPPSTFTCEKHTVTPAQLTYDRNGYVTYPGISKQDIS